MLRFFFCEMSGLEWFLTVSNVLHAREITKLKIILKFCQCLPSCATDASQIIPFVNGNTIRCVFPAFFYISFILCSIRWWLWRIHQRMWWKCLLHAALIVNNMVSSAVCLIYVIEPNFLIVTNVSAMKDFFCVIPTIDQSCIKILPILNSI